MIEQNIYNNLMIEKKKRNKLNGLTVLVRIKTLEAEKLVRRREKKARYNCLVMSVQQLFICLVWI